MLKTLTIAAALAFAPSAAHALDNAGKCRDMKTRKFAKCSAPGTEPVPSKK